MTDEPDWRKPSGKYIELPTMEPNPIRVSVNALGTKFWLTFMVTYKGNAEPTTVRIPIAVDELAYLLKLFQKLQTMFGFSLPDGEVSEIIFQ